MGEAPEDADRASRSLGALIFSATANIEEAAQDYFSQDRDSAAPYQPERLSRSLAASGSRVWAMR